jgi:hypothetical protein
VIPVVPVKGDATETYKFIKEESHGTRSSPHRRSLQDNKLLAKKCDLGFPSRMRSEHSDEQSAEQLQVADHPGDDSSPSRRLGQPRYDFR